ncbi:MAG: hypothetical protein ACT4QF_23280 [Sporichthyaceae bacterium]
MRRRIAIPLVATIAAAGLGLLAPQPSSASCAGPQLVTASAPGPAESAPPSTLRVGEPATVEGRFFYNGCEDSYRTGGCGRGGYDDPQSPMRAVELTLTQGDRSWALGTADAADRDRSYAISWAVAIPADARSGPATLAAGSAQSEVVLAEASTRR